MDLAPSLNWECGLTEQTSYYVVSVSPIHQAPHGTRGLRALNDELYAGLTPSLPASDPSSAAV